MKVRIGRVASGAGAVALLTASLAMGSSASAAGTGAVPWASANFHGYANGTEVHLDAATIGTTKLADVDQAFSGASTSTAGLTSAIPNEVGLAVQPAQPASTHAYGRGSGLEAGLLTSTDPNQDPNQLILDGLAQSSAPPDGPLVTKALQLLNAPPVVSATLLGGKAASFFDAVDCPLGQPLSYGAGDAANVNLLTLPALVGGGTAPVANTAGTGTSTAQAYSDTFLSQNSDQTYGLATSATDIIAPITLDVLGIAVVKISVHSAGGLDAPVTLTAKTTGEGTGASVRLSTNDLITATITIAGKTMSLLPNGQGAIPVSGIGADGLHIDLNTKTLGFTLTQIQTALTNLANSAGLGALNTLLGNQNVTTLLNSLGGSLTTALDAGQIDLDLGTIDIDTTPHAIGGSVTSPATLVGGTDASGALDLVRVHLGVTGSILNLPVPDALKNLVNLAVGHLEASSHLAAPIACPLPIIKTASAQNVQAGHSFTYTIDVPDLADVASLQCDLSNITVTDTISDDQNVQGDPTFTVTSAKQTAGGSAAGTISPPSATSAPVTTATVTWHNLSWKRGSPPDVLSIDVSVPASSPSGRIQDTVVATGTLSGCSGGVSGDTTVLTTTNNSSVTGTFTLEQPGVTAAGSGAPPNTPASAALPFTGAMGGPWQPIAGVGALGLGGGALALAWRARRRRPR